MFVFPAPPVLAATLLLAGAVAAGCTAPPRPSIDRAGPSTASGPAVPGAPAIVTHIDDGDTIDVRIDGATERVRFIGVDTAETKKPNTPVQCYGPEASAFTAGLLPLGTEVRLVRDTEPRDPYGRLLAYVYRASDGLFVNLELARLGYAAVLSIAPNTAHAGEIADAVATARQQHVGLWGACPSFGAPASPAGGVPTSGG
jgi:micrococcal nuclease